jgi:hypothetical protein
MLLILMPTRATPLVWSSVAVVQYQLLNIIGNATDMILPVIKVSA